MNVLIALPKNLIDSIIVGKKIYEMRSFFPRLMQVGEDGFFVVEKGSSKVRCWCRVDNYYYSDFPCVEYLVRMSGIAVSPDWIRRWVIGKRRVFLWRIGKVIVFEDGGIERDELLVDHNPRSFAYCPLSYGESF